MLHLTPFLTVYCCVLAALLGACMGSFLNCMAWRVVHGESVLRRGLRKSLTNQLSLDS